MIVTGPADGAIRQPSSRDSTELPIGQGVGVMQSGVIGSALALAPTPRQVPAAQPHASAGLLRSRGGR
jgi:hypothetical protein